MSLTLHYHPLSSYCWKALIALYDSDTPFSPNIVDLGDPRQNAALKALWPIGKFPVLRDELRGETVPESSIIIEHLAQHQPGAAHLMPLDLTAAREVRLWDRLFDRYIHDPMQKIVSEKLRPVGSADPFGADQARAQIEVALAIVEARMADRVWVAQGAFTLADCAAAPALYYANRVAPFRAKFPNTTAYLARLKERPSVARVLSEAEPYFHMFPGDAA